MTRHPAARPGPDPAARDGRECHDEVCVTCADQAERQPVVELRPGGRALVETATGPEEVSVALVEARVGDLVLVHAKEAIGVIRTGDHGARRAGRTGDHGARRAGHTRDREVGS